MRVIAGKAKGHALIAPNGINTRPITAKIKEALFSMWQMQMADSCFTSWALRIYCAGLGIFGAQIACQMTFTSLANATASIMVAVMRKFILLVPLIYIVPHLVANKTMGVYLAEPIADFISVIFTIILFFFQFRKAIQNL